MTRLRDIMTKEVVTIAPDVTIRDAMSLLSTRHISGAPVVSGREVVGVITATDLMAFAAELPGAPAQLEEHVELGELETRDEKEDGRELEPPGTFFTELWEDAGADVAVRFASSAGPEWNVLDEHTVEEAMTRAPICKVSGETTLTAAAEFMRAHSVHRVLVTDGERLVGIATSTDLANAIADYKLRDSSFMFHEDPRFSGDSHGRRPHAETALGEHLPRRAGTSARDK